MVSGEVKVIETSVHFQIFDASNNLIQYDNLPYLIL